MLFRLPSNFDLFLIAQVFCPEKPEFVFPGKWKIDFAVGKAISAGRAKCHKQPDYKKEIFRETVDRF